MIRNEADELLARAMRRSAASFSLFKSNHWKAWLAKIRPSFRFPEPDAIGRRLLNNEYMVFQKEAIRVIGTFKNICIKLDGATNKAGKQFLNMMACWTLTFFLMHFSMKPIARRR